jgi:2-succinyl-6-hydroxy-2,4-cyclohexadiene-1-carboxylate synthase
LLKTLNSYNILNYWLMGYSLGGRVAMFFACQPREGLCGLIVEGGIRACRMPPTPARRCRLGGTFSPRAAGAGLCRLVSAAGLRFPDAAQRGAGCATQPQQRRALAAMLQATSLAVQPDLRAPCRRAISLFICGRDGSFAPSRASSRRHAHIHHAGHNAHRENPDAVLLVWRSFAS